LIEDIEKNESYNEELNEEIDRKMKSEKLRKLISKIPHKFQIVLILYEGVWNKDAKKCEKDIEATAKMLKKQIAEAKTELEKEAKKYSKNKKPEVLQQPNKPITTRPIDEQKPEKPIKQPKAVDVLESLVEQGIPVEHALNVVKEAMKGKEGDVDVVAREKIVQEIREGKINLPVELKEKIREQLQVHIQTQTQLQNQMLEQKLQLQTYQETQTQLQLQEQYQQQYQYQQQQEQQYQQQQEQQYQQKIGK
jgi:murein DD-endopeptidase MepM/ murein hydrolase activator NlpD